MISAESASSERRIEGGAFHPDLPKGRASGTVTISYTAVQFRSDHGDFDLPAEGLNIELGGANNRLIFFKHPAHPQTTIHTADHSILEHALLKQNPAFARQRARVKTQKRIAQSVFFGVLGSLIGALALLYLFRDSLVKTAARGMPVSWEIKAGDKLFEQMMVSQRLVTDPELTAQLQQITDPLVAAIKDNRYPLKFHIVENATLNAFALPGGNVVLHSGLLMAAESPEEIAGVLGHEIAHVTHRHSIRNILSSAGLFLVVQTLLGDVTGVIAVLADNSAFLMTRKFSRDFEREADNQGWEYLLAANIRPEGMIQFFQRMQEEEARQREKMNEASPVDLGTDSMQVLSTHPATQERMDYLRAKWEQLPADRSYRNFDLNYAAFKASLRTKLHATDTELDQKD
jgi:predicted Zn-dependent protease